MPSHVRIFFWLSIAVAVYWAVQTALFLMSPSAEMTAALAQLPSAEADNLKTMTLVATAASAVWNAIIVLLAWLAAFRRSNWARWLYASQFVLVQLLFLSLVLSNRGWDLYDYFRANWMSPGAAAHNALIIAAIVFIFTGNARAWFRREMASAS